MWYRLSYYTINTLFTPTPGMMVSVVVTVLTHVDNTWLVITIRYWHNLLSLFVWTAGVVWGVSRVKVLKEAVWPRVSTKRQLSIAWISVVKKCADTAKAVILWTSSLLPCTPRCSCSYVVLLLVGCEETWRWHHSRPCPKVQCLFIQCQSQCHSLC